MSLKKGKIYQGKVLKMVYGGKGIIKIDDFVVFVEKAVTGQEIEFQISKLKKNHAEGKLISVLKKAPNEIQPGCQHFGECGGCKWQHLPYAEQLKIKAEIVKEQIDQVMRASSYDFEEILPSPNLWNYRNKLDFSFGYQEMQMEKDAEGNRIYHDLYPCLGFHRPKKFELILPITNCEIASPEANQILNILQNFREKYDLSVHNPKTHKGFMRNVIVRKGERTGEVLVNVVVNFSACHSREGGNLMKTDNGDISDKQALFPWNSELSSDKREIWNDLVIELKKIKGIVGILLTHNKSWNDAVIDGYSEILWGRDYFYDQIGDLKFKISPDSFFQTNTQGAEKLYQTAKEFAGLSGTENVVDLYCGTGTIGLFLADQAKSVFGVEIVEAAIENAKLNAELNQIQNARFLCDNIDKNHLTALEKVIQPVDVLVLDPPRAGIAEKALKTILGLKAKKIVYVSCNPTTFARDLKIALESGYNLKRVRPVDMFPHTHHIELVAELNLIKGFE